MMRRHGIIFIAIIAIAILLLILSNSAFAERVTIIKEYTYLASDIDSKVSSRTIALELVKRILLEQLGILLINETEVKNYQMTKDQITTITAGIVSTEILEEQWDGRSYYIKARLIADPDEVSKTVDAIRFDKKKSKELEDSKRNAENAMKEIDQLKNELLILKADTNKQNEYAKAIGELSAADWIDKAYVFFWAGRLQEAIGAFSKAIEANPDDVDNYTRRGALYGLLKKHQLTLEDYNKVIEMKPQLAEGYINRGRVYSFLGNNQQAVIDFNKAVEVEPRDAEPYNVRGFYYYQRAMYQQALKDYHRVVELDPKEALPYVYRGSIYAKLGNNQKAIKDYDKAVKIDPSFELVYRLRAISLKKIGNINLSIQDFKIAAKLGDDASQEILRKENIPW